MKLLIICIFFQFSYALKPPLDSMQIKNLKISKCQNKNYPIVVNNVDVKLNSSKVKAAGSLYTSVDLESPIQASLNIKRKISWLDIWISLPCENNLGSCTYKDLCAFGYPESKRCPQDLIDNNVPCRCPIKKGNYTIAPTLDLLSSKHKPGAIYSGLYKGTVSLTSNNKELSCYDVNFQLYDEFWSTQRFYLISNNVQDEEYSPEVRLV